MPADQLVQLRAVEHEGHVVQGGQGPVFNDTVRPHVAEGGNLLENPLLQGLVAPGDDHIRHDAHALQLPHRVLGGLCLVLAGALEPGHQHHMEEHAVLPPFFPADLAQRLQKGLALDVADGAADLGDDHIRAGVVAQAVDELLDLPGDVGDGLHRAAQILPCPLLVQHVPVDPAAGEIGQLVQVLVDEPLIVAQVQVGLHAVLGDEHLAVLIRAHGAGVHVDVGVQLLGGHLEAPLFQQPAKAGRADALAQAGHHAAGDENMLCHRKFHLCSLRFCKKKRGRPSPRRKRRSDGRPCPNEESL